MATQESSIKTLRHVTGSQTQFIISEKIKVNGSQYRNDSQYPMKNQSKQDDDMIQNEFTLESCEIGPNSRYEIEEKRLDLELTAETRRSLQRKQKFMDKLMSQTVYHKTQCLKKQTDFYNSLAHYSQSQRRDLQSVETNGGNYDPEISVQINQKVAANFETTSSRRLQHQHFQSRVQTTNDPSQKNTINSAPSSQIQIFSQRNVNQIKSFDGTKFNNQKLFSPRNHQHLHEEEPQLNSARDRNLKTTDSAGLKTKDQISLPYQPLNPNFLRRKLSPLGTHGKYKTSRKVFQFSNYRAYADHSGVVPASEKMTILESIESADSKTKLQMILKKRNDENSVDEKQEQVETQTVIRPIHTAPSYNTTKFDHSNKHFLMDHLPSKDSLNKWVHIQKPPTAQSQHRTRRYLQDEIEKQIRETEQQIKEKRRKNEAQFKRVEDEIQKLQIQLQITARVANVELKTQSAADSELMESSVQIVDEVHNLYRNFNKDLQLTSQRTKTLLDQQSSKADQIMAQVDQIIIANQNLEMNIKFVKAAIKAEQEAAKVQKQNLLEDFGRLLSQDDSVSVVSSAQNQKGGITTSLLQKIERINAQINKIIQAKTVSECAAILLAACKSLFSCASRVTLFIVDMHLQYFMQKKGKTRANFKDVPCEGVQSGSILAVFEFDDEFCAPVYTTLEGASKMIFSPTVISVPIMGETDQVIFTLQIEIDQNIASPEKLKSSNKRDTQNSFKQSEIDSQAGSAQSPGINQSKKLGKFFKGLVKKKTLMLNQWNRGDLIVCQLISLIGSARFDVFIYSLAQEKKLQIQRNVVAFSLKFMNFTNMKQVLNSVKNDLPKLLGFSHANIYMIDDNQENLYAISIDEDHERRRKQCDSYSFEEEFYFDEKQIIRFPITMGVNGLAFKTNSVTYFNKPVNLNNTRRAYASLYAIGNKVMPEENQSLLGRKFGKEQSFNQKSDNFLDLDKVSSLVITSLIDEEDIGFPAAVGTLQLFNRRFAELSQDDLARISFVRKLVGSTLIKCQYCAITLQTIIGVNLIKDQLEHAKNSTETMVIQKVEGSFQSLTVVMSSLVNQFLSYDKNTAEVLNRFQAIGRDQMHLAELRKSQKKEKQQPKQENQEKQEKQN